MSIYIKKCENQEEIVQALQIRGKVFIDEQNVSADIEIDDQDYTAEMFLLYEDDIPAATIRIIKEDNVYYFGRLAVLKEYRHKGYASNLLEYAENVLKERNIKEVYLHAQIAAKDLYEKNGYSPLDNVFMEADIPHVMMKKVLI